MQFGFGQEEDELFLEPGLDLRNQTRERAANTKVTIMCAEKSFMFVAAAQGHHGELFGPVAGLLAHPLAGGLLHKMIFLTEGEQTILAEDGWEDIDYGRWRLKYS
jgi:hypothetical protein